MKIRFQADADLNEDIVSGVLRRVPEIDFKTANESELGYLPDTDVLALAAADNRILVTHNRRTMPSHFADFIAKRECAGVLVVSQEAELRKVIDDLILIWFASEAEEYVNSIRTLPL